MIEHAADGDAGHLADEFGDVVFVDGVALGVLGVPVISASVGFLLDGEQFLLDPGGRFVILSLSGGFLFCLQFGDAAAQLDDPRWRRLVVDHEAGGGLVDQVDGLVGQTAFGQVALGEADSGFDGLVADRDSVVRFVARPERVQDGDGVIGRGLVEVDGRETSLEGGVFLDVAAVFVQCGRADDVQFASSEGRFEHVGGVDRALGGAGADDRVDLVDEEDDLALALADLVDNGLEPLLEFAPELGSGEESAHVERHQALAAQVLGHVVGAHALGQRFGDGGLADPGLADDDGIVLGPAVEDLQDSADFGVSSDHGIELALGGEASDVGGVAVQSVVMRLGVGLVDSTGASNLLEGFVEALGGDAVRADDLGCGSTGVAGEGDQEVLDADVLVVESLSLDVGTLQELHDARRHGELDDVVTEAWRGVEHGVGVRAEAGAVDTEGVEQVVGQSVVDAGDAGEQVLDVPLRVTLLAHELLGCFQQLLGLVGESISSHHRRRSVRSSRVCTVGRR